MSRFGCIVAVLLLVVVVSLLGLVRFLPAGSGANSPPPAAPATAPVAANLGVGQLIVPVAGVRSNQLTDTWGQSRENGARVHQAIDIPAPRGTPVLAALPGRVEKLFESVRGGTTVYVRSPDERVEAYYAHLSAYAPGLSEGQRVAQGQTIGFVGDSGDAGPGNTHLHFALAQMQPGEKWWQGTPVNPYPLLTVGARLAPGAPAR